MVNTVLGKISEQELGTTLCHEHIFVGAGEMAKAFGDRYYNKEKLIERAVSQLKEAKDVCGLSTFIDGTPIDLGRDVDLLVQVSKKSGVNIIASTGFYYDDRCFLYGRNPQYLAEFFIDECRYGMENTYQTDCPVLPGMLKCATDFAGITEINELALKVMAITQRETGLPMFAHNNHSVKTAMEQLRIFAREGADLSKVIIGHVSDTTDISYIEDILKSGVFIGFDRIYCNEKQVETLCQLLNKGYANRILLSRDGASFNDFGTNTFESECVREENTFTTVLAAFLPMLEAKGVSKNEIKQMTAGNYVKLFA